MMKRIQNIWRKISGKGYYIALILCAAAIGITGYLYYRNQPSEPSLQSTPTGALPVLSPEATTSSTGSTTPPAEKPSKTGLPLSGQTLMDYSMDALRYDPTTRDWRTHAGIDIAAEAGAPVCAAADGVIYTTYDDDLLGTTVVIRHDGGYVTTYSSLDSNLPVAPGDTVSIGQTIGYVGCSAVVETALGDHLHFCVTHNDQPMNPQHFFELG